VGGIVAATVVETPLRQFALYRLLENRQYTEGRQRPIGERSPAAVGGGIQQREATVLKRISAGMRHGTKQAGHYLVYLLIRVLFCVIQAIPLSWCERFASGLAWVLSCRIRFRRAVIMDNLAHAFPQATPAELERISYEMWRHLVLMACEVAQAPRLVHETNWRRYFSIENRRNVVRAVLDERPLVLVAGHFGNFELGGFICGILGTPTYTVARRLDNPYLQRFITDFRQRSGQYILPKDGSSDLVEAALSGGHKLTLLGDQYAGDKGVWVDFLGRPASCNKALALLTLTSGAPMVVVANRRTGSALHFAVDFGGLADPGKLPPPLQSVQGLTQWYNERLAEQIRQYPGQYWWVHRRWKPKSDKDKRRKKTAAAAATAGGETKVARSLFPVEVVSGGNNHAAPFI